MKKPYFFFSVIISLILSACTLDTERPINIKYIDKTNPNWQQHLSQIKKIQQYSNQGQLGYISTQERFSTRFNWQYQNSANYLLTLSSTISSTTLTLEMRNNLMRVYDNKGNQRATPDAKQLLKEMIGVDFPLEQFALWLKGQPDEKLDYKVGENHLLASFSYPLNNRIWTADYLSYHQQNLPLPKDILLKTEGQTLKIRIDNWKY
ncbi:MAG: lipoprotein insertase outer membrane protein LolB [Pasteurella oralis]|uniref:lipoprotein insertase outer membrane protein LolB n=1 Tax=Pasteurella oralis TaxID=1071947 RepID=UPI000C7D0A3D|nr:lipoprotein insertase outer membrane protein LolB [Pasteurella oralis]MDO5053832.1 lipoprotein insertase outer membrane protein LolB [Pasteurella oralis]